MEYSTISVKKHTKQRLDSLGSKNDSYDDVIRRLLDNHKGAERERDN